MGDGDIMLHAIAIGPSRVVTTVLSGAVHPLAWPPNRVFATFEQGRV